MHLRRHGTIDIWMNESLGAVDKVLLFNENEHGHAGYLALRGLVGWNEPDARITSHLINNIMFNQTIEPNKVGWEVYKVGDFALVNLNEWPNTTMFPIEESKSSWINAYPVVRDTLEFFKSLGASELKYISTSSIHEMLDEEQFPQIDNESHRLIEYIEGAPQAEGGIFMTPPAWLFPHFAKLMGYEEATTSMFGFDEESPVNNEVGATIGSYLHETYDLLFDESMYEKACDEMNTLTERVNNIQEQMEELMKGKPANNTMWG